MEPEASASSAGMGVQRLFEPHRLASECQAQAYERVLPLDQSELSALEDEPRSGGEGVAA